MSTHNIPQDSLTVHLFFISQYHLSLHGIWYQPTTQTQLRVIIHLSLITFLISFKLELLEVTNYVSWECKMKCTIRIISWERCSLLKNASITADCWELWDPHTDYWQWLQMQALPHMTDRCWHVWEGDQANWQHKTHFNLSTAFICFNKRTEARHWEESLKGRLQKLMHTAYSYSEFTYRWS